MRASGLEALLTALAVLMAGGIVHLASLLVAPEVAPDDAYRRLSRFAADGAVQPLPRAASAGDPLPARDPEVASAVCLYDLGRGPLRVSAAVGDAAFLSVSLHARSGAAFYGLTDRSGLDGRLDLVVMTGEQLEGAIARDSPDVPLRDVRVVAPETRGFVSFDVMARVGGYPEAARGLTSMACDVERPG